MADQTLAKTEEGKIILTVDAYNDLVEDQQFLRALERAGVDNWDGYDFALEIFQEMQEDTDD